MEFFNKAQAFRLKCSHNKNKYLAVNQYDETIKVTKELDSKTTHWVVEPVEGKSNIIRLRSRHTRNYLACTDEHYLLGMTGNKVVQRHRLDTTVEWEPIKEGGYVKLKSHVGTFLRANRGPPPWRNSVTNDLPGHWTGKEDMILWIVDYVKMVNHGLDNKRGWNGTDVVNGLNAATLGAAADDAVSTDIFGADDDDQEQEDSLEDEQNSTGISEFMSNISTGISEFIFSE